MRSGTSWAIAMTLVASFERLVRGVTLLCLYREGVRGRNERSCAEMEQEGERREGHGGVKRLPACGVDG